MVWDEVVVGVMVVASRVAVVVGLVGRIVMSPGSLLEHLIA